MPVDRVFVKGIRGEALVGLLDWEQRERQPVEVDVDVVLDTVHLLRDQSLEHGVDFVRLIEIVHNRLEQGHVGLVEVLADQIAKDVLDLTVALSVEVTVRKYRACQDHAAHVGVTVRRGVRGKRGDNQVEGDV